MIRTVALTVAVLAFFPLAACADQIDVVLSGYASAATACADPKLAPYCQTINGAPVWNQGAVFPAAATINGQAVTGYAVILSFVDKALSLWPVWKGDSNASLILDRDTSAVLYSNVSMSGSLCLSPMPAGAATNCFAVTSVAQAAAQAKYAAALAAGLTVTWTTSTTLNGTYPLGADPITGASIQTELLGELASFGANGTFTNGQASRGWPTAGGGYVNFTVAQFKAFATAQAAYLDALATAEAIAAAGGTASWPSANVTISQ